MVARDAWVNTLWIGHHYDYGGLKTDNYMKWDLFESRLDADELALLSQRETNYFFGIINRVSYSFDVGPVNLEPRWKSEFRHQTIDVLSNDKSRTLTEIGGMLRSFPLLQSTRLQAGVELNFHNDLRHNSDDFNGVVAAVQFSNLSAYLGYGLRTNVGLKIDRRNPKNGESLTVTQTFISAYAGL